MSSLPANTKETFSRCLLSIQWAHQVFENNHQLVIANRKRFDKHAESFSKTTHSNLKQSQLTDTIDIIKRCFGVSWLALGESPKPKHSSFVFILFSALNFISIPNFTILQCLPLPQTIATIHDDLIRFIGLWWRFNSFKWGYLFGFAISWNRYKPAAYGTYGTPSEDSTPDYMNVLSMVFSMCGLMVNHVAYLFHSN